MYVGGDEVTQGFGIKSNFERRFPGMKLDIVVAHLQTLHDFDDWAARGLRLPYKPIGRDQIPAACKDPAGRFTGLFMLTLANSCNKNDVSAENAPRDD